MVTGVIEKIRIKRLRPCKRQSVKRNIINVKMILILTLIYRNNKTTIWERFSNSEKRISFEQVIAISDQTPENAVFVSGIVIGKTRDGKRYSSPFPATGHIHRYVHHIPASGKNDRWRPCQSIPSGQDRRCLFWVCGFPSGRWKDLMLPFQMRVMRKTDSFALWWTGTDTRSSFEKAWARYQFPAHGFVWKLHPVHEFVSSLSVQIIQIQGISWEFFDKIEPWRSFYVSHWFILPFSQHATFITTPAMKVLVFPALSAHLSNLLTTPLNRPDSWKSFRSVWFRGHSSC